MPKRTKFCYNIDMKRFYITGVSGTGKSSVALELNKKEIPVIDIDEIKGLCRWVNKKTKEISHWYSGIGGEFFEMHEYICDKEKLIALMNKYKNIVVVVGLADNQSNFLDLFDKIFLFYCNEEIFIKRIKDRINHDFGRHKSEQKMILSWYKDFEKEMLNKGAIPIDTEESLNMIVDKVIEYIKS